jgi:hypothetical protein
MKEVSSRLAAHLGETLGIEWVASDRVPLDALAAL